MNHMLEQLGMHAKDAEVILRNLHTDKKNEVLCAVAGKLTDCAERILEANAVDVENGRKNHMPEGLIDRLMLTRERIEAMAEGLRQISELDDPIGDWDNLRSTAKRDGGCLRTLL